ncbi:MAG: type II toxin-antitoxin system RelE/ParE family toxin [Mariprofundus sp.]
MISLPVEFSPSALSDLRDLLDYYEEQDAAGTGKRMAKKLIATTQTLPDYPHMGRVVPEFDTPSLRELIRPPYRIVYRLKEERISIIRIWRSERLLDSRSITL